jgi:sodium-dependent dicarboxylate transporter 2/3/5
MITKVFFRVPANIFVARSVIDDEWSKLGRTSFEEAVVLVVFLLTALLWVFRKPLDVGFLTMPGWSEILPYPNLVDDGTVAMVMALLLFLIPTRSSNVDSPSIMSVEVIKRLPWNIVLLFGGGFALAKGFQVSGLSEFIGNKFGGLSDVSPLLIILIVCLTITFLTELTSNTATTEMILPILASVAIAMRVNPLMLMIPATLAASQAFMMPVATPPNAIVFGSQRVSIPDMAKGGLLINFLGIVVITLVFYLIGTRVFGIDPSILPDWAERTGSAKH